MRKTLAFIAFMYHYLAYKIPMRLMHRAYQDMIGAAFTNGGDNREFSKAGMRWAKWARIVNAHQAKCDKYREIIESA